MRLIDYRCWVLLSSVTAVSLLNSQLSSVRALHDLAMCVTVFTRSPLYVHVSVIMLVWFCFLSPLKHPHKCCYCETWHGIDELCFIMWSSCDLMSQLTAALGVNADVRMHVSFHECTVSLVVCLSGRDVFKEAYRGIHKSQCHAFCPLS